MQRKMAIGAAILLLIVSLYYYINKDDELTFYAVSDNFVVRDVYIDGAVLIPGYYKVLDNYELKDLIKMAGGTIPSADLSRINLNEKITKKQYYIDFYTNEDDEENPLLIKKINLNTATVKQLETIPGMTQKRIEAFLVYRKQVGTIYAIEELLTGVSGIGEVTFEKIKPYITV